MNYARNFFSTLLEVMPDHIHMLVEAPPKYAPSAIVGILKGQSSKKLRQEFSSVIRKYIWKENTLWARGYYIASVADGVTTELIQEYIDNQKSDNKKPKTIKAISEVNYIQAKLF